MGYCGRLVVVEGWTKAGDEEGATALRIGSEMMGDEVLENDCIQSLEVESEKAEEVFEKIEIGES